PFLSYRDITARSLVEVLGVEPRAADAIGAGLGGWPLFADSAAALRELLAHAPCVAMTNSDRAHRSGIERQLGVALRDWICAEDVKTYKPDVAFFRAVAARRGLEPGPSWWHVSAYADYDLEVARGLGLTTVFVGRPHARPGPATHTVDDLRGLAELVARAEGLQ